MRSFLHFISIAGLLLWASAAKGETITVSAAISLQDVLNDIKPASIEKDGVEPRFNFGSSGQLMGQIREGAPVDLFISAAPRQVDTLIGEGLADAATRTVIAGNRLVLVVASNAENELLVESFADLDSPCMKRIAIGDPRTVPAGEYAKQVLNNLGLFDDLKGRLVYGMHVRQVLDYVERGEVSAGVVYLSDALKSGAKVCVAATADQSLHESIDYVAVIMSGTKHRNAAETFLDRLSAENKRFEERGFAPTTQPTRP